MRSIIKNLIFLSLIVLLMIVATAVFIGTGYLFSLILPLTLFQSSILSIGATFVLAFIIQGINANINTNNRWSYDDNYDDDYEDDDENEEESNDFSNRQSTVVNAKKVGRNKPCPCGSGKKYKNCCGK